MRFFFTELLSVSYEGFVLYFWLRFTVGNLLQRFDEALRAEIRKFVIQRCAGIFCRDRARQFVKHVTCIQPDIHSHNGDTRFAITRPQ
ncbi:hypothetical protein D3C78_1669770 [compost metagenome]